MPIIEAIELSKIAYKLPSINEFVQQFVPIIAFGAAIAIYAILIWYFYRSLAKRDLISINLNKYDNQAHSGIKKFLAIIAYIFKFGIIFPLISFVWFAALAILLFMLAKTQTVQMILIISMSIVTATRITAYYKEDAAREIAKLLPIVLLGITIIEPTFFSTKLFFSRLNEIPNLLPNTINFLFFIILLELILKTLLVIKIKISWKKEIKKRVIEIRKN